MSRILYSGNRNASSWAFRAWLALKEQKIPFEEKIVDIRRPQRWDNLKSVGEISPPAAVPVLDDDGFVIFDSLAIMEYASELGEHSLLPSDIQHRAKARSFVSWQHSTFSRVCPALSFESSFYPEKKQLSSDEVAAIEGVYDLWESTIIEFEGMYLIGAYSLADIMLLPSVLRLTSHFKPDDRWPNVVRWVAALSQRPYVKAWVDDANALEPIYVYGYRDSL
jgi:glutathione S-transferase